MFIELYEGKNNKNYAVLRDVETKEDFKFYEDYFVKTLSRRQYFPFMQGFNKTQEYSYLYDDYIFPVQFLPDVCRIYKNYFEEDLIIENEEILYNNDINEEDFYAWIDTLVLPDKIKTDVEEYRFQQESVYLAIKNKISHIEVGTSGGKTFIAYLFFKYLKVHGYVKKEQKLLMIVPSKNLCIQTQKDFTEYESLMPKDSRLLVETIYAGAMKFLYSDIVVGTYQSLRDYEVEYFNPFVGCICDEVHKAKTYSIKKQIYEKMYNCEYFFGMTGTINEYQTLDYLHTVSMFGKIVLVKKTHELIATGVSTPVVINKIKIEYSEPHYSYSQNLIDGGIVGIDKLNYEREFFHSYEPRMDLLMSLQKIPGNNIILVDTIDYAKAIYERIQTDYPDRPSALIYGKVDNREDIFDEIRASDNFILVGTFGTMSTGISINNLQNLYFPDGGKAFIKIRQSIGRILRLDKNKKISRVFDFQDQIHRSAYRNHWIERNKIYKSEKFPTKEFTKHI